MVFMRIKNGSCMDKKDPRGPIRVIERCITFSRIEHIQLRLAVDRRIKVPIEVESFPGTRARPVAYSRMSDKTVIFWS